VLGYTIRQNEGENYKIVKAVAIYIEWRGYIYCIFNNIWYNLYIKGCA
jgi:hypothetical protein